MGIIHTLEIQYMYISDFVKDKGDKGEIRVKYYKPEHMILDYFIKLLQGDLLHMFREIIMGVKHIITVVQ